MEIMTISLKDQYFELIVKVKALEKMISENHESYMEYCFAENNAEILHTIKYMRDYLIIEKESAEEEMLHIRDRVSKDKLGEWRKEWKARA
jgi:hypothetical protein